MHDVDVPAFMIAESEVTVAAYTACVMAQACTAPSTSNQNPTCNYGAEGREEHPVNCLRWHEAKDFAACVDARLPTESEWEFAVTSRG